MMSALSATWDSAPGLELGAEQHSQLLSLLYALRTSAIQRVNSWQLPPSVVEIRTFGRHETFAARPLTC
jgi:hypothetical protein